MRNEEQLLRFERELLQRGVPRRRSERAARELADHWDDLREEGLHKGLSPRQAEEEAQRTLGDLDTLAGALKSVARATSSWQRCSALMFLTLPVVMFSGLFALLLLLGAVLGSVAGWWRHESRLGAPGWMVIHFAVAAAHVFSLAATQALFTWLATRGGGPRCALYSAATLAIYGLVHQVTFTAPGLDSRGSVVWSYGWTGEIVWAVLPLICLIICRENCWLSRQGPSDPPGFQRSMKIIWLVIAVTQLLCWPPGVKGADLAQNKSVHRRDLPNIVLILADDMGYGDPGCYNPQSKIRTPHIDRLAGEGLRFMDAHAPGALCHPSRYGLLTGQYPFRVDVSVWPKQPLIEAGRTTIASLLKSQGYHTAMVGKWHLGFLENGYDKPLPGGPVDCGFETFFGIRASTDIPPYFYIRGDRAVAPPTEAIAANQSEGWSPIQGAFWREGRIAPDMELKDVLPRLTREAIDVIQAHGRAASGRPLMLYLAFPAPHTPWLPAPEFAGRSQAGMYGDFTEMVDAMIGRVLAALQQNLGDNTLVVFTSDNGPVWYEADVKRFGHNSANGLRGMKGDAWEAGHRMPFIVRWPGRVKAGAVSTQTICFTDLLATFASIAGIRLPADAGVDSFSLLPVLLGVQQEDQPIRGPVAIPSAAGLMTIRSGPWKLIDGLGSGGFSEPRKIKAAPGEPKGQLYNLDVDPGETTNVWTRHPEIVERLERDLKSVRSSERSAINIR